MADIVSRGTRSRMMSLIRGKNTQPELLVRKALFLNGFRYVLHDKRLPGTPDLVFPKYRSVVVINGCFWHGHGCKLFKWPKTNASFWKRKIRGNLANDKRQYALLSAHGWRVKTIWECSVKGPKKKNIPNVAARISAWLTKGNSLALRNT